MVEEPPTGDLTAYQAPTRQDTQPLTKQALALVTDEGLSHDDPVAVANGYKVTGRTKDRDGRTGVTIAARGTSVHLVIDPSTAQLLDYIDLDDRGTVNEYLAFERQGWVHKIGATPTS